MKLRAIPQIPNQLDPQLRALLLAMKENLEMLSGQRGTGVEPLAGDAALPAVAEKVNELIGRLT